MPPRRERTSDVRLTLTGSDRGEQRDGAGAVPGVGGGGLPLLLGAVGAAVAVAVAAVIWIRRSG